jgi:hypothetical protein
VVAVPANTAVVALVVVPVVSLLSGLLLGRDGGVPTAVTATFAYGWLHLADRAGQLEAPAATRSFAGLMVVAVIAALAGAARSRRVNVGADTINES